MARRRIRMAQSVVHVAAVIELGRERLYEGILQYAHLQRNWRVIPTPHWLDPTSELPDPGALEGVIGYFDTDRLCNYINEVGCPAVLLGSGPVARGFCSVEPDDWQIGRMAAEHLLSKGIFEFVFCGPYHVNWSKHRHLGFAERILESGLAEPKLCTHEGTTAEERVQLAELLADMSKPVGVFGAYDGVATNVTRACIDAGLAVPEEVAVLGCDDNWTICHLMEVPVSSVVPDHVNIGLLAAKMLGAMLEGQRVSHGTVRVPPLRVQQRRSTDIIAIGDSYLSQALRYLRDHVDEPVRVEDLAAAAATSRRNLQTKFRRHLRRTALEEIHRVRMDRARQLLRQTNETVNQIALQMNFPSASHFSRFFQQQEGVSPSEYRRRLRLA